MYIYIYVNQMLLVHVQRPTHTASHVTTIEALHTPEPLSVWTEPNH